ncbi:MAG: pyruvate, phosphate dikinase [Gemmatimonadota bacterium]|nr:MAG: pyruvate, phosphate dikinase [Gemmatimonadota bacterium]
MLLGQVPDGNSPSECRKAESPQRRLDGGSRSDPLKPVKSVFFFADGQAEGNAGMADHLGGKGANLAEMTNLGIPVPPGFTISANLCLEFLESGKLPDSVVAEIRDAVDRLERATGRGFGDEENPLLVSVRSGAKDSMPGMMDTVLNLGLNERSVAGLASQSDNPRFAYDSYRRFIQMFGEVVHGVTDHLGQPNRFVAALNDLKLKRGVERDIDLAPDDLKELTQLFKEIYKSETGSDFPEDPWAQLVGAVEAVFGSWNTKRAIEYRRIHKIPHDMGTAVNVVSMVYGNMGEDCGTGVVFTRDPGSGENRLYGEFLINAQGEDVVAGIRDPEPIERMKARLPQAYDQLLQTCDLLEEHYKDMQDVEFTVECGKLYLLQTRSAKRTAKAAVRVAVEMTAEGMIDRRAAVARVSAEQLDQLLHPTVDPSAPIDLLTTGLPASPGAAVGTVVFDSDRALELGEAGLDVILVRRETVADDFPGMVAARAILTSRGGMTSHAAVVARGMGKCCVAGAKEIEVNEQKLCFTVNGLTVWEGEWLTVDGSTGRVILGKVPLVEHEASDDFATLMSWADDMRMLRVRTNADTPADAARAREFGAEGIGLCRTEHMFFESGRIEAMREMILAPNEDGRRRALNKLLPMQREDFLGIFRAMDGYPVTIRLLDPPLHEFLPHDPLELEDLSGELSLPRVDLERVVAELTETNPMLGHRGCRLGITYPEITEMQSRAVFEAACQARQEGVDVHPEVMVPLVGDVEELSSQERVVRETAELVFGEAGIRIDYLVGTMIELPRAAITADQIAQSAEFFSLGTNDLTQTVFGMSRDDAGRFLPSYVEKGLLRSDPFQSLDQDGVGQLVAIAVERGRSTKKELKIGICGEHGGDPSSVGFFHRTGLDYVSCSPFRVPIARLAAAHAAIDHGAVRG